MKRSFNKKYLLSILVLLISFFIISGSASAKEVLQGEQVIENTGKTIFRCSIPGKNYATCDMYKDSLIVKVYKNAPIGTTITVKAHYYSIFEPDKVYQYNVVAKKNSDGTTISSQKLGGTINLQVGGTAKALTLEDLGSSISESKFSMGTESSDNSNIASIKCTSGNCTVVAQSAGSTQVYLTQVFNDGSTIKWYFPVNVASANSNSENENKSIGTVSFLNLEGSSIDIDGFTNCSGGSRGKACKYEAGKRYYLASPTVNSKYGKFLGWTTKSVSDYCSSGGNFLSVTWTGTGNDVTLYAIYENSCSKSGASAYPIQSTPKSPASTPITGPAPTSNAINGVNWAEALESGECRYYDPGIEVAPYSTYSYSVNGKSGTGKVNLYSATEMCNNKDTYHAICYDPHKATPSSKYEFDNYIDPFDGVNAFPGAAGDSSIKQEAFIYYIYQKHGNEMENQAFRAAAVLAIRAYEMFNDSSSGAGGKAAAYWALANSWECSTGSPKCQNNANVTLNFGDLEGQAKSLYLEAKAVAETCTAGGTCSGLDEIGVKWSEMQDSDCDTEGGNLVKKIKGEIDGLGKYGDKYIVKELICPAGLTCELRLNGSVIAPGTNIAGNGATKYEIWVKGSSSAFANAKGDVGIRVEAYSFRDYHNVILIKPTSAKEQRLIIFKEKDGKPNTMDIVVADISNVTCGKCGPGGDPMLDPTNPAFNEEMYKAKCCDEPDADPKWCPVKDDVCVQVNWNLVCGADGEVYQIHEGISQKTGKLDYKNCIINNTDPAENTYNIIKNRYCTISCKEDWEFQMPGDLGEHKAGTYMILAGTVGGHSLRVKGSRSCVAGNGSVQTAENEITTNYAGGNGYFQRDLYEVDKQIVSALNQYSEAAAQVYMWETNYSESNLEVKVDCGGTCSDGSKHSPHHAEASITQRKIAFGSMNYNYVEFDPQSSYDTNGKLGASELPVKIVSKTTTPKCTTCGHIDSEGDGDCRGNCSVTPHTAEEDYDIDAWKSQMSSAKSRYNQLVAQRQEMIDDITECNTWQNNFKYEPEISYMYQEHDYMNQLQGNNKFQIIGGGTPGVSGGETSYRDQESKRDDYSQMSGGSQGSAYQQGNTNNIFTCTLDDKAQGKFISSCNDNHQKMYYSSSILLEKQAEYSYEIKGRWYTIHDSGSAMYSSSEDAGDATDDKTTMIGISGTPKGGDGKVLPISENTQPGDYKYQLRFVDVGQYNEKPDNQTLGRLIGGDDKSHTGRKSVFAALKGYKNMNTGGLISGELDQTYECAYHIVNKNPCASKIKTEIISLLDCPDGYRCSGYGNDSGYIDVTGDVSFFVSTRSNNNLSPNRPLASNWQTEEGQKAKEEIESLGDEVFAKDPQYSVTISPQGLVALQNQASSINYGGFELSCNEDGTDCPNPWLDTLEDIDGVTVNNLRS